MTHVHRALFALLIGAVALTAAGVEVTPQDDGPTTHVVHSATAYRPILLTVFDGPDGGTLALGHHDLCSDGCGNALALAVPAAATLLPHILSGTAVAPPYVLRPQPLATPVTQPPR